LATAEGTPKVLFVSRKEVIRADQRETGFANAKQCNEVEWQRERQKTEWIDVAGFQGLENKKPRTEAGLQTNRGS